MYRQHFGLSISPFSNTPDPRFFLNTPDHEEALASLLYVAQERKGFAVVTGEVGTGKTLLARMTLARLPAGTRTALITHPQMGGSDLLAAVCGEFKLDVPPDATVASLMSALESFLLEQYARDRLAVVILDEGQNLRPDAIEQLRLLGNLEAEEAKLLQVLILGQPELNRLLARDDMRQLRQRVFRTYHIHGLDAEQTAAYVRHRLNVAGANGRAIFTDEALAAVFAHAQGLPRLVNQVCDNALLAAYAQGALAVSAAIVHEAADHIPACRETAESAEPAPPRRGTSASIRRQRDQGEAAFDGIGMGIDGEDVSRAAELERLVFRMDQRQQSAERRLEELTRRLRTASEERGDAAQSLAQARALYDQAARMLNEAETAARSQQDVLATVLEQAEIGVRQTGGAAADAMADAAQGVETLCGGTQRLGAEIHADGVEIIRRLTALMQRQSAEQRNLALEMRRLSDAAAARWAELDARQAQLGAVVQRAQEGVASSLTSWRRRAEETATELAKRLEGLVTAATRRIQDAQAEFQRSADASRDEVRAARTALSELHERLTADAAAFRTQMEDVIGRAETLLTEVQRRAEAVVLDVGANVERMAQEAESKCAAVSGRLTQAADDWSARAAEEHARANRLREELAAVIQSAQGRFDALRASWDARQPEMNAAASSLDEMSARLNSARGDAEALTTATTAQKARLQRLREELDTETRSAEARLEELRSASQRQTLETEASIAIAESVTTRLSATRAAAEESVARAVEAGEQLMSSAQAQAAAHAELEARARETAHRSHSELHRTIGEATMMLSQSQDQAQRHVATLRDALEAAEARKAELTAAVERIVDKVAPIVDQAGARTQALKEALEAASKRCDEATAGLRDRIESVVTDLEARVAKGNTTAVTIGEELERTVSEAQAQATRLHAELAAQRISVQLELRRIEEETAMRLRQASDESTHRVEQARRTAEMLKQEVDAIGQRAESMLAETGRRVAAIAEEAAGHAAQLQDELQRTQAELADRAERTQVGASTAAARAEAAIAALEQRSNAAHTNVRAACHEMQERAAALRDELAALGRRVGEDAAAAGEAVRQSGSAAVSEIESQREAARIEAQRHQQTLTALVAQAEQTARQTRTAAGQLLADVQEATSRLRAHADDLLQKAQAGADRLGEQSANLLSQSQAAAEQFRTQASELLRRAEASAADIRRQAQTLREEVKNEAAGISADLRTAVGEARGTQQRTEELIARADDASRRSQKLLSAPQEILAEATQRSAELKKMSDSLSSAIVRLGQITKQTEQRAAALASAGADADVKSEELARRTTAVTQLVGVLRQLYDAMDARVTQLRVRLEEAGDIARGVPRQIETLRDVLGGGNGAHAGVASAARRHPSAVEKAPHARDGAAAARTGDQPGGSPPRWTPGAGPAREGPSLGELARKNARLNAWLRKTLAEVEQADSATTGESEPDAHTQRDANAKPAAHGVTSSEPAAQAAG